MKVLLLNGSPRRNGNTARALQEMESAFASEGIETETVHVGKEAVRGCIACGSCGKNCIGPRRICWRNRCRCPPSI